MVSTASSVLVGVAVGANMWFLSEYVLHRFAFHEMRGRGIGSREHLEHHVKAAWGIDLLFVLVWSGVVLTGLGWGLMGAWVAGPAIGLGVGVGWTVAYFTYEWHHRAAHLRGPRNRWERWLRKHHFHHHFGHPLSNQGVTMPLWDVVFGTIERPDRVRVPRRLAMPWLLDPTGEVREEFSEDYELVGSTEPGERQEMIDRARAFANLTPLP